MDNNEESLPTPGNSGGGDYYDEFSH